MLANAEALSHGKPVDIRSLLPIGDLQTPFLAWHLERKLDEKLDAIMERLNAALAGKG
jgi:hypothetical protein